MQRTSEGTLRLAWALTLLLIVLFIGFVGSHAIVRYESFHSDAFDLGNMNQAVWNTLHGHPFRFTNHGFDWHGPPTRLGIHVEPILLLIAPLYLIHDGPETLLLLQTVALALGALPLFTLSLRRLPELPLVGAALVFAYLISPLLLGEALWDFHAVALATPLLLLAIWALDARRYGWLVVAVGLALMTKEDVGLAIVPIGVYLALWRGRPRLGSALALLALAWVALCFFVILPHFSGGAAGGNNYWYRYSWAGDSAGAAARNILAHPWLPLVFILGDAAKRGYLASLLRTGGGLGLLAPVALICALPELAVNLLSSHPEQYSGFFQYNAMLLAFLMASAVYGCATLYHALSSGRSMLHPYSKGKHGSTYSAWDKGKGNEDAEPEVMRPAKWLGRVSQGAAWLRGKTYTLGRRWRALLGRIPLRQQWIGPLLVLWLVVFSVWNLATTSTHYLRPFWDAGVGFGPHQAQVDALLARIPDSATVAVTDTLDPQLSSRYTIYLMPDPRAYEAEYVAANVQAAASESQAADSQILDTMLASGHYVIIGQIGTVVVLHRTGTPLPTPDK